MKSASGTAKVSTYTLELEKLIAELYDGGNGMEIKAIAADPRVNRSPRSVLGKLVYMGKYVKPAVKPAAGFVDTGPSKKEFLATLENSGLFTKAGIEGLGNATKPALQEVIGIVERVNANQAA